MVVRVSVGGGFLDISRRGACIERGRSVLSAGGGFDGGVGSGRPQGLHLSYVRERTGHALIGARQWIPAEHIDDPVKYPGCGCRPGRAACRRRCRGCW